MVLTWLESVDFAKMGGLLLTSTLETVGMVLVSLVGGEILGILLGTGLILVRPGGLKEKQEPLQSAELGG
jgi:ABC-type methionine transport system permease subunit